MRVKITTTIEETLLNRAKLLAKEKGFDGANAIIEKALEQYFKASQNEVWEKVLQSGWIKRIVVRGDSILYENLKCRKTLETFDSAEYTEEVLENKGWKKI